MRYRPQQTKDPAGVGDGTGGGEDNLVRLPSVPWGKELEDFFGGWPWQTETGGVHPRGRVARLREQS